MLIPNDPVILLSFINTKLRDEYSSLEDCSKSMNIDSADVISKLSLIGYEYDPTLNKFV